MLKKLKMFSILLCSVVFFNIILFNNLQSKQQYFNLAQPNAYNSLPKILSEVDANLYNKIAKLQDLKDYAQADVLISQLNDDILLGYIYYIRYTNSSYKVTYNELKNWLDKYHSIAVASSVYKLAKRKSVNDKQIKALKSPNTFYERFVPVYMRHELYTSILPSVKTVEENKLALQNNKITQSIANYLKKGKTLNVKNILQDPRTIKVLDKYTYDHYASTLAKSYFLDAEDELAVVWGRKVINRNIKNFPETSFTVGLAYYRMGEFKKAAEYFYYLAKNPQLFTSDVIAKGAYWYAKASLNTNDVNSYYNGLNIASDYIYNFYGIIANEELGLKPNYNWKYVVFNGTPELILEQNKYGKRAFALLQFGLADWAEQELIFLANYDLQSMNKTDETNMLNALLYMAQQVNMPALSLKLSGKNGMYYGLSHLSYPVFFVDLKDGYDLDPSLLLALMRRESLFYSSAESGPGARGLMQIMPETAQFIVKKYNITFDNNYALYSPSVNIDLGQKYVKMLLDNPSVSGNLIYVLAGFNGGAVNVENWKKQQHRNVSDPLFFIESIPFYETRNYVKSVLTDYWIYQTKMKIETHTLSSLVQGGQPIYYAITRDTINSLKTFSYAN